MDAVKWIRANREKFIDLSNEVWDFAELGFKEARSAELLARALEVNGFTVQRGVADIPTAFVASFGEGKPVIAILGEYDALPGISQECVPYQKPRQEGGNGHGCGHNLLGVGSLAAAMAAAEAIHAGEVKGTIRFYGCPAEENGAAKTFMVKAGVFDDVDLCLTWHPDAYNGILGINILANIWVTFRFHGKAAHAAADPQNGRSALDAVELMNVGTNYLREHLIPEARIHYIISNGGGSAPNVVPPLAESQYIIRAPLASQVNEIYPRVLDIARGAALMTGTELEVIFKIGMSNLLLNDTITDVLYEKMLSVGAPEFNAEEIKFAEEIGATFPSGYARGYVIKAFGNPAANLVPEKENGALLSTIMPNTHTDYVLPGSTDVGDVSWVTPTGQITAATMALGTPGHSWQTVAQSRMGIGQKGMLFAGETIALTALEFMANPKRLQAAREEFEQKIRKTPYVCPIPDGVKPF
jgi:aminobenzoyl-glutamate utilization protein B